MKKVFVWIVLAGALLGAVIAQAATIWPNMVGVWKGYFTFVTTSDGYGGANIRLVIKDQQGPLFRGFYTRDNEPSDTNWFSGSLQSTLMQANAYDMALSVTADEGSFSVGSALLVTSAVPWKMTRVELRVYNGDTGIHGNTMARGTLTKK